MALEFRRIAAVGCFRGRYVTVKNDNNTKLIIDNHHILEVMPFTPNPWMLFRTLKSLRQTISKLIVPDPDWHSTVECLG